MMDRRWWKDDRLLGYAGVIISVVALVLRIVAAANPDAGDWLTIIGDYGVGLIVACWLVAVTARHVTAYGHGRGRALILTAWMLVAALFAFTLVQSLDPAREATIVERLPTAGDVLSMAGLWVPIPLLLASLGLLRDVSDSEHGGRQLRTLA